MLNISKRLPIILAFGNGLRVSFCLFLSAVVCFILLLFSFVIFIPPESVGDFILKDNYVYSKEVKKKRMSILLLRIKLFCYTIAHLFD